MSAIQALRRAWNALSRKNACFVCRGEGGVPWTRHRGLMSSKGSRRCPQFSHWSPRAFLKWHRGHSPSTYRSGRKWFPFAQNGDVIVLSSMYPFPRRVVKISWTSRLWFGSAVFQ